MADNPNLVRYTSKTFDDIKNDLLRAVPSLAPALTSHGEDEPFIALLEMLAGIGDALHYNFDKQALETFLPTVKLRKNALKLAHLVGYRPLRAIGAIGQVRATAITPLVTGLFFPKRTQIHTQSGIPLVLEEDLFLPAGFSGAREVNVVQGELKTQTFTSTGLDEQSYRLLDKGPSEQLFRVLTLGTEEWIEFRDTEPEHPLGRWYHYEEDRLGFINIRFRRALGNTPLPGTPITVEYLVSTQVNIADSTAVRQVTVDPEDDATAQEIALHQQALGQLSWATTTISGYRPRETVNEIRYRAPMSLHTRKRAVDEDDYVFLARSIPGVRKAKAVPSDFFAREVVIHVLGEDITTVPTEVLDAVEEIIGARNNLVLHTRAIEATLEQYRLVVDVKAQTGYTDSAATYAVKTALESYLLDTALEFGRTLRVGEIYSVANRLPEVNYANVVALHKIVDDETIGDIVPSSATAVPYIGNNLAVNPII